MSIRLAKPNLYFLFNRIKIFNLFFSIRSVKSYSLQPLAKYHKTLVKWGNSNIFNDRHSIFVCLFNGISLLFNAKVILVEGE